MSDQEDTSTASEQLLDLCTPNKTEQLLQQNHYTRLTINLSINPLIIPHQHTHTHTDTPQKHTHTYTHTQTTLAWWCYRQAY